MTAAVAILVTTALYARLLLIAWRYRRAIQALNQASRNGVEAFLYCQIEAATGADTVDGSVYKALTWFF